MSKANAFVKSMDSNKAALVENATIHKDTHHVSFAVPEMPKGITPESLNAHEKYVNEISVAARAALSEIAVAQYPETNVLDWDGELKLCDGITITANTSLKTVVGEETMYGVTDMSVDHLFSDELTGWYDNFQSANVERAKKLFD